MQCQAKAKSTGEQCKRRAVAGKLVSTVHGGLTPGGIASASYKHGRYSKYLPARLAGRYEEAAADPDLLVLRQDIALVDARLADLLKRVDKGESGHLWRDLKVTWEKLEAATDDKDARTEALRMIRELIKRGASDSATWSEIHGTIDQRRKLVESERKRLVEMQQVITAERAMVMLSVILDIIKTHVTDRNTLASISEEIRRLTTVDAG